MPDRMITIASTLSETPIFLAPALQSLAKALEYPSQDSETLIWTIHHQLESAFPEAEQAFQRFAGPFLAIDRDRREELYTSTFDITPACVPYASIHLFGEENFKRGEFMAALNERYSQIAFDPRGELTDHVAVLLRFAAEIDPVEQRELVQFCLLGPLEKMHKSLTSENPYCALLETVRLVLHSAHPGLQPALSPVEQMRQHGGGCESLSAGCGCGSLPRNPSAESNNVASNPSSL